MTISIKNQFVCKLDIANFNDFVQLEDLIELLYVEDAAMALPAFEISFILRDERIIPYLNEGSIFTLGLGKDELNMLDIKLRIVSDFTQKRPSVGQLVSLSGVYYDHDFSLAEKTETFNDMTSLDAVRAVAKRHFPMFKTNLTKTVDIQNWQKHSTAWKFLSDTCLQGYLDSSTFLVGGFDSNTFYYYDYKKLLADATSSINSIWTFSKQAASSGNGKIITYNTSIVTNDSGATARALGGNPTTIEYDWKNYTVRAYKSPLLSYSSVGTNKLPLPNTNTATLKYRSLNTNESYTKNVAISHNVANMTLNDNVLIGISFAGQFKNLKIFDPVYIDQTGDPRITGLSVIIKVAYQITNGQLYTNVTLARESLNELKGDLI